jgi:uncharacterized protein YijF (DUF1287 family)
MVIDLINSDTGNHFIVDNIGEGPKVDDMLFDYKITGHYSFIPKGYKQ